MRLLLAEDERELANALTAILKHNNYSVDTVYDGQDAFDWGQAENYDGIILDVMMPRMNGYDVTRRLRERGISTPILMLTARSATDDKVTGLDSGADDYLTKPFEMKELLARVRALTRRSADIASVELTMGSVTLDKTTFELRCGDRAEKLSNKEFQIMEMLMASPGRVVSTEHFMEKIWGYDTMAEISVVWVYISYLRKKLAAVGSDIEIKASRGVGYSLEKKK